MTEHLKNLDVLIANDKMFYDREVVPKQEKIIENVVVGTPEQVMGSDLYAKIEAAYADPESDMSMENVMIMSQMQNNENAGYYAQGSRAKFAEVDGLLIRRRTIDAKNNIEVTEVLNRQLPPEKTNRKENITQLKYEHYIVTDKKTGKSTNMMDLKPHSNSNVYLEVPIPGQPMGRGDRSNNQGNEHYILDADMRPDAHGGWFHIPKEKFFIHEVPAHGSQDHPTLMGRQFDQNNKVMYREPYSSEDVADMVNAESNAWKFTEDLLKKYRSLGINLESASSDKGDYRKALETYDVALGTGNKFVKAAN